MQVDRHPEPFFRAALRALLGRSARGAHKPNETLPLFHLHNLLPARRGQNEAEIRALCRTVSLPDGSVICRVLGRYKMRVEGGDYGLSSHLMLDGYWEMWVTEAMASLLRPGMVALDAGANVGYYTLLMAELVGPAGRVHALEPNPRLAEHLYWSIRMNARTEVTLHARPLGAASGRPVILHVPAGLPQNGHVVPGSGSGSMRTITVDEIVGDGPLDFIKIDVEGAEWAVWQGMAGVLARRRPLVVVLEYNRHRGQDSDLLLDSILEHGFSLAQITMQDGIVPVTPAEIRAREDLEDWMLVLTR